MVHYKTREIRVQDMLVVYISYNYKNSRTSVLVVL